MQTKYDIHKLNNNTYILKIKGENNDLLYKTIKLFIRNSFYDDENDTIIFSAEKVTTLKNYLSDICNFKMPYNTCIKMIDDLTKQLIYLKKQNFGFYGFNINDILVIDDTFVFCSSYFLLPLVKDYFIFYSPIETPYFSNPEILGLKNLPSKIYYKCAYYSLGSLITFCLLNKYLLVGNEIKSVEDVSSILHPLNNTKLYWFIIRCLDTDMHHRKLLLI
jgi:hypothetical protein